MKLFLSVRGCKDVGFTQPHGEKLTLLSRYLHELLLPPGFVIDGRGVEAR